MFVWQENYDEEIEAYKHHLEQTYKLCRPCQTAVEYYIKYQNRQLRTVLLNHQLRRSRESDKAFLKVGSTPGRKFWLTCLHITPHCFPQIVKIQEFVLKLCSLSPTEHQFCGFSCGCHPVEDPCPPDLRVHDCCHFLQIARQVKFTRWPTDLKWWGHS